MDNLGHILIADDDENVVITLKAVLEREHYEVSAANSRDEAEELARSVDFNVALVDLRLGDADGLELLGMLKDAAPDSPVIILTGYASLESSIEAIRRGAYDYLVKPCEIEELKMTVSRAMERGLLAKALKQKLVELEAANAHIQGFADELQTKVTEATHELSEKVDELAEAKKRVESSQRQREEFIKVITHELAQPLTALTGCADLLDRRLLPPELLNEASSIIVGETRRLKRLVRDLADASTLASGSFQIHSVLSNLESIVRGQVLLARATSDQHNVEFESKVTVPARAWCDPDRIAQVLSNLLTNAIRYTKDGTIRVTLSTDESHATIAVADEGPGIAPEHLTHLFEPYFRLEHGGENLLAGMGLGLYITKAIAEAHGGKVVVESVRGKGSTFKVILPLVSAVAAGELELSDR